MLASTVMKSFILNSPLGNNMVFPFPILTRSVPGGDDAEATAAPHQGGKHGGEN